MRTLLLIIAALGPWALRKVLLIWLCKARFGVGARVGHSYIDVQRLEIGSGGTIGSLNCFRFVKAVDLEDNAMIGNLNWFSGASHKTECDAQGNYTSGCLTLHNGAAITNRHYFDMHANIEIGIMALIAGVRSTLLTHSINFVENRQVMTGISIGDYTFIGTNAVLLPGAFVPARCVCAAGAVVAGRLEEGDSLYGGVPARKVKALPLGSAFLSRSKAFVE